MPRSVLLLLLAASAPSADPRVIRLTADDPPAVEASGLSAPQLAWLRKLPADDPRWAEPLRVYVVGDDGTPARTPLLGGASLAGDRLRFVPRFPLAPGGRYRAVFDLPPFPETPSVQGVAAGLLAVDLTVPRPAPGPATVVAQVYPTADRLPANVLRLYVQFSAPMSRGGAYQYLTLFDAAGKALPSPFLELEEELWSADGTRFTLYFHPGRVKRGLESRDEAGPALDEGKRYTLAVSADWPDAAGRPLRAGFRKEFRVGPADFDPIDPERWILVPPAARDGALVVRLPKPLDRALLGRLVTVTDAAGRPVPGRASVGGGERVWTFAPDAGWAGGEYRLVVDPRLEDPCGNRVGEPFEIDEARPAQQPREAVSRPFSVR
jgi:hypothetical protein